MHFDDDPLDFDDDLGVASVQEIFQQVGQDSVRLIRLEVELLKRQAVERFGAARRGLILAALAVLMALAAFAALLSLIVVVLDLWLPLWAALTIVFIVLSGAAWGLQAKAREIVETELNSRGSDVEERQ